MSLAPLRKLAREAAPGPWNLDDEAKAVTAAAGVEGHPEIVLRCVADCDDGWHDDVPVHNAAFIATARNTYEALLDAGEALDEVHERLCGCSTPGSLDRCVAGSEFAPLHSLAQAASPASGEEAERLARFFHETYERLAPSFGYKPRPETSVPWEQVPENNKRLMIAVAEEVLQASLARERELGQRLRDTEAMMDDYVRRAVHAERQLAQAHKRIEKLERALRYYSTGRRDKGEFARRALQDSGRGE